MLSREWLDLQSNGKYFVLSGLQDGDLLGRNLIFWS
jgi:hypothetical protein